MRGIQKRAKSYQPPLWLRVAIPAVLLAMWLAVAGVGGPYFGRISEVSDVDLAAFLPKNAESSKLNEEAKNFRDRKTLPAIIVFQPTDKAFDTETTPVNERLTGLSTLDFVVSTPSPLIVSDDAQAGFGVVQIDSAKNIPDALASIRQRLDQPRLAGVNYHISGVAGFSGDLNKAFSGIDGILLAVALAVVFVILLAVYRSILLPIVVLMTSLVALTASIFVVWQLANAGVIKLNGQVQGILFILVIGAATDYSLLYVARFREELHRVKSKWVATQHALRGAFEPIIASGSTVIVGLLCMLLSDLGSNKSLGPVGAIGVAMAMAAALTFLPTVLYALGRASFWPMQLRYDAKSQAAQAKRQQRGLWPAVGRLVQAQPRRIWLVTGAILLVLGGGIFWLKADGVPQNTLVMGYSDAREGQAILTRHFPAGSGSPVLVTALQIKYPGIVEELDLDPAVASVQLTAEDSTVGGIPVGKAETALKQTIRDRATPDYEAAVKAADAQTEALTAAYGPELAAEMSAEIKQQIPTLDSIVEAAYPFKDAMPKMVDGRVLMLVTLRAAPDSAEAKHAVARLRGTVHRLDSSALVGGATAAQLDTNDTSIHDRAVIIPAVLAAITIILMIVLRSIVAPLLLLLTTVISFGAALGVAAWLFNDVWKFPGADPSVVLYAFVFLVALGIDYNIFLMTRVREESLKIGTHRGVIRGLVVTGGVITSAGVVLAATFAALVVIPILFLFQLAFIVTFGVLLDTIVVRSLLVPALIRDIGAAVWWPSNLRRKP